MAEKYQYCYDKTALLKIGVKPNWFNMMISKKYEHSLELKRIISEGIAELFWSGKFKTLLEKHELITK